MLAEPRYKRSYILAPKGKPLYEDEDRFGTKLLLKMGWSKGKGLGRNENGSADFLRVRYKNDAKGFGFVGRDDQWTQHEQSFNGLLNTLNGQETDNLSALKAKETSRNESEDEAPRIGFGFQNTTANEEVKSNSKKVAKLKEKISGISLEEKSKQSRARVHYKKFTRGKDLSQYSEKDLANIFGKKEGEVSNTADLQQEEFINKNVPDVESNANFQCTGVSITDYFKMKMEAKRKQLGSGIPKPDIDGCEEYNGAPDHVQEEEVSMKRKKDNSLEDTNENEVLRKKTKKSKKHKNENLKSEDIVETVSPYANISVIERREKQKPKKNKKKSKSKMEENTNPKEQVEKDITYSEMESVEKEQNAKKNKKKSKNKSEIPAQQEVELEQVQEGKTKREKRKRIDLDKVCQDSQSPAATTIEIDFIYEPKKKNTSCVNESSNANENEEIKANIEDLQTSTEKKKSKSKNKELSADLQKGPFTTKANDVSSNANSILTKNVNIKELELDDIEKLHNSYNIYRISSFCAEKFRNINLNDFKGSILPQIEGYGFSSEIQLDVQANQNDEERITNLWKCVLSKYVQLEKPKKTYNQYVKEVIKARKMKQKQPKLYIKTWKRKNAFQIV